MLDIILDALIDVLKLLPFLFISFIIMELVEHKLNYHEKLTKVNKLGPLVGSALGVVPQCGFSALASNLYAARVITLGTLISIYLSTSDEMLPIMISQKTDINIVIKILLLKFIIGLFFGFLIDLFYRKKNNQKFNLCKEEHCHCEEEGILKSSIIHTIKIIIFIFVINVLLNTIIDESLIRNFATSNKILAPILSSIVGLIPNCAASVIITELYLENIITLGSCISGLLAGSGVGILVLFKQNHNLKENLVIVLILIGIASICGIVINYL